MAIVEDRSPTFETVLLLWHWSSLGQLNLCLMPPWIAKCQLTSWKSVSKKSRAWVFIVQPLAPCMLVHFLLNLLYISRFVSSIEWKIVFIYYVNTYVDYTCWYILPPNISGCFVIILASEITFMLTWVFCTSISHRRDPYSFWKGSVFQDEIRPIPLVIYIIWGKCLII